MPNDLASSIYLFSLLSFPTTKAMKFKLSNLDNILRNDSKPFLSNPFPTKRKIISFLIVYFFKKLFDNEFLEY